MSDAANAVMALLDAAGLRVSDEDRKRLIELYPKVREMADLVARASADAVRANERGAR